MGQHEILNFTHSRLPGRVIEGSSSAISKLRTPVYSKQSLKLLFDDNYNDSLYISHNVAL